MKNKYVYVGILLAVILAVSAGLTSLYVHRKGHSAAAEELNVVTSFYPVYIAAANVTDACGGVRLQNLSEPQTGCLHDYQLTSEDMKLLSTADIFIVNGGGIESFLEDIAKEYPDLTVINACEGISLTEDNAHAWMSMELYKEQIRNICDGLGRADASRRDQYAENADRYIREIEDLQQEYQDLYASVSGTPVVLFHEAYEYLAEEYGMEVAALLDLDEERQVSAGEVAQILQVIETENVPVIFAEELYGKAMGDMMERETGIQVLYLDALNRGDYEDKDSYLTHMRANLELIRSQLDPMSGDR